MFNENIKKLQNKINSDLNSIYSSGPQSLVETFNYVISGKGKRIRPLLTILTSNSLFNDFDKSYNAALAIEILHNFTLVHDDIMDDDDVRRGRPTCHIVFGEANAVLAGDALLTRAFGVVAEGPWSADGTLALIKTLDRASGGAGMVGGQIHDIGGQLETLENVEVMQRLKTGALIKAAAEGGALASEASEHDVNAVATYGAALGLRLSAPRRLELLGAPPGLPRGGRGPLARPLRRPRAQRQDDAGGLGRARDLVVLFQDLRADLKDSGLHGSSPDLPRGVLRAPRVGANRAPVRRSPPRLDTRSAGIRRPAGTPVRSRPRSRGNGPGRVSVRSRAGIPRTGSPPRRSPTRTQVLRRRPPRTHPRARSRPQHRRSRTTHPNQSIPIPSSSHAPSRPASGSDYGLSGRRECDHTSRSNTPSG
mgnify:CR=1 FL=1